MILCDYSYHNQSIYSSVSIYKTQSLANCSSLADRKMDMIKNIPVHMDYVGQGRAEKLYQVLYHRLHQLVQILFLLDQIIIVLFGVVGLGWGYTIQQFSQTVVKHLVALKIKYQLSLFHPGIHSWRWSRARQLADHTTLGNLQVNQFTTYLVDDQHAQVQANQVAGCSP